MLPRKMPVVTFNRFPTDRLLGRFERILNGRGTRSAMMQNIFCTLKENCVDRIQVRCSWYLKEKDQDSCIVVKLSNFPGLKRSIYVISAPEIIPPAVVYFLYRAIDWNTEAEFQGVEVHREFKDDLRNTLVRLCKLARGDTEEHGPLSCYVMSKNKGHSLPISIPNTVTPEDMEDGFEVAVREGIRAQIDLDSVTAHEMWSRWSVNHLWPLDYVKSTIEMLGSVRIYDERDEICSWVVPFVIGSIHMLQTVPGKERNGHGKSVMMTVSKLMAVRGWTPCIHIFNSNKESDKLNRSIGYEKSHEITLLFYKPRKILSSSRMLQRSISNYT